MKISIYEACNYLNNKLVDAKKNNSKEELVSLLEFAKNFNAIGGINTDVLITAILTDPNIENKHILDNVCFFVVRPKIRIVHGGPKR